MSFTADKFPGAALIIEDAADDDVQAAISEQMEGKVEALAVRTFVDPNTGDVGYAMTLRPEFGPEASYAILMATALRIVSTADELLPGLSASKVLLEAFEFSAELHSKECP